MVYFGATRWDAYWSLAPGAPALDVQAALSDSEYQWRAPIHALKLAENRIQWQVTQEMFDNEIQYCSDLGGPNFFWNYLLYPLGSTMRGAINFHMSSSIGYKQKFTLMVPTDGMGSTNNYQSTINEIANSFLTNSFYFKLGDGTPVLYIYYNAGDIAARWSGNIANLKAAVDYLRSKFLALQGANPYVIVMCGANDAPRVGLGAECVSNYISGFSALIDGTYAQLDTSTRNYWGTMAAAVSGSGGHISPITMAGWGSFPRHRRPVQWGTSWKPEHGMRYGYAFPTPSQLQAHVQAAVDYCAANPALCPKGIISCYAFNENDEGGWLTKTFGDPTGLRMQAVRAAILG